MPKRLPVGIDSYCLVSTGRSPVEVLDWADQHGAAGVQFTSVRRESMPAQPEGRDAYLRELGEEARRRGMYLEWGGARHIPFNLSTGEPREIASSIRRAMAEAAQVGTSVIRSCSGGLMRWQPHILPTETMLEGVTEALRPLLPELAGEGMTLAIELHFEFTTFELLRVFEMCEVQPGGPLGICLDTMNTLVMLEDPVLATERVLPWVVATHAKDGMMTTTDDGFRVYTTEAGKGLVNWAAIIKRLQSLDATVSLSLEDHGGIFEIPYYRPLFFSRFPDVSAQELARLHKLARLGDQRYAAGQVPVAREDWPCICEDRVSAGIRNLQAVALQG